MDKAHVQLANELDQLNDRIESEPEAVLNLASQCLLRSDQVLFPEGGIQACIIISKCCWKLMDYASGSKHIKEALNRLNRLDTDLYLPEILHIHALNFWGQAKYYSAQQFWINALEQAALVGETEIEIECLIGLGNVWRITEEHKLALSTHELAVQVANNARVDWLEGKARILLAQDHYHLNDYTEMLSVLDEAEEVLKHHPDPSWRAEIWDFRGLALLGLERIKDAEIATTKAYEIAIKHDLLWMKTHTFISKARLEMIKQNFDSATEFLTSAEESANNFDHGELLSQICFQQSIVAERQHDYERALIAFRKYRKHSMQMMKEQTSKLGMDKARSSKRQLDQRARKLINRIRRHVEFNHGERGYSNLVSETYWWEQLVLFKSELKAATHAVLLISHENSAFLEVCMELTQCICNRNDLLSRISENRIGLLIAEKGDKAEAVHVYLQRMIADYPWQRRGLVGDLPKISLHDILSFPFTLDQLEDQENRLTDKEDG
ncbi:hypothetical protein P7F88_08505 [Vibrio hannami]|uniref:hypothetical protein n=1 Tax=Vibrio hannami TaxID=2717094 RepID=UPI002410936E|nr:hypothetical protein [Vibrio hannami]MDG3086137.1 hypothetical protein [Vibrio hannami]